jgi:hypothetical protein
VSRYWKLLTPKPWMRTTGFPAPAVRYAQLIPFQSYLLSSPAVAGGAPVETWQRTGAHRRCREREREPELYAGRAPESRGASALIVIRHLASLAGIVLAKVPKLYNRRVTRDSRSHDNVREMFSAAVRGFLGAYARAQDAPRVGFA